MCAMANARPMKSMLALGARELAASLCSEPALPPPAHPRRRAEQQQHFQAYTIHKGGCAASPEGAMPWQRPPVVEEAEQTDLVGPVHDDDVLLGDAVRLADLLRAGQWPVVASTCVFTVCNVIP